MSPLIVALTAPVTGNGGALNRTLRPRTMAIVPRPTRAGKFSASTSAIAIIAIDTSGQRHESDSSPIGWLDGRTTAS